MSCTPAVSAAAIQQWIAEKLDVQAVQEKLLAQGCDEAAVAAQLTAFKKAKYAKRQFKGFIFLGAGAFLGFISCTLTLVNPIPELYDWFLYGLTSVAITLMCTGLYYIFE